MTRKILLQIFSCLLFLIFCAVGFRIAAAKPLWNDELFTQHNTIQNKSWQKLLIGRDTWEGNNAPLFYLIQKWTLLVPGTAVSAELVYDEVSADLRAGLLLRIVPVLFMSGALAILFYFFSVEFSVLLGFYALFCALASPNVWFYWAEARPYVLMLFFTLIQSLFLIKMSRCREERDKNWMALAVVHFLLVLTSYLSVIQVVGAAVVCWLCGERERKRFFWILLPVVVAVYYRLQGIHEAYELYFTWGYFLDNIPLDRIVFYVMAGVFLFLARPAGGDGCSLRDNKTLRMYSQFLLWAIISFSLILLMIKLQEKHMRDLGLHSRFLIALTPIGIVEQVLLAWCLLRAAMAEKWLGIAALFSVVLLSVVAFCHTSAQVIAGLKLL